MTPQKAMSKIKKEYLNTFVIALAAGLIIHGFRLTNHLLTWDSVFNFYDPQKKPALGRLFLSPACALSSYYDIQWVSGLLALLYLSVTAVILCILFDIKSRTSRVLLCGMVMAFPVVSGTFAYMYTADGYMLACLCSAVGVFLAVKERYVASAVLIMLSAGMYQAYVAFGLMISVCLAFVSFVYCDSSIADILKSLAKRVACIAVGVIAYFIINKAFLSAAGIEATDYNGMSEIGSAAAFDLAAALRNCVIDTVYFFVGPVGEGVKLRPFTVLNFLLALYIVVIIAKRLFVKSGHIGGDVTNCQSDIIADNNVDDSNGIDNNNSIDNNSIDNNNIENISIDSNKNNRTAQYVCSNRPGRLAGIIGCLCVMPFICFMIYFISPGVRYYMLMYAPIMIIYLLAVVFFERESRNDTASSMPVVWGGFLLCTALVFNFALISNINYLYMVTDNAKTMNLTGRLAGRIEELEGYGAARRLLVVGKLPDYDRIELMLPPGIAGVRDGILFSDTAHFAAALDTYFDIGLAPVPKDEPLNAEYEGLADTMPVWPAKGSVDMTGDTVIVRFS